MRTFSGMAVVVILGGLVTLADAQPTPWYPLAVENLTITAAGTLKANDAFSVKLDVVNTSAEQTKRDVGVRILLCGALTECKNLVVTPLPKLGRLQPRQRATVEATAKLPAVVDRPSYVKVVAFLEGKESDVPSTKQPTRDLALDPSPSEIDLGIAGVRIDGELNPGGRGSIVVTVDATIAKTPTRRAARLQLYWCSDRRAESCKPIETIAFQSPSTSGKIDVASHYVRRPLADAGIVRILVVEDSELVEHDFRTNELYYTLPNAVPSYASFPKKYLPDTAGRKVTAKSADECMKLCSIETRFVCKSADWGAPNSCILHATTRLTTNLGDAKTIHLARPCQASENPAKCDT